MNAPPLVRQLGGIAYRQTLRARGIRPPELAHALAKASLMRVLDDGALRRAVAPTASRLNLDSHQRTVVHWNKGGLTSTAPTAIEPIERMLVHIAQCQSLVSAVAAFDSAVRTGAMPMRQLQHLALAQTRGFREVLFLVDGRADTGIESIPRVRFALLGITMAPQVVIDDHPVDGLIGERLIMQFDGFGPHADRVQRNRDLKQDARFVNMGCTVLRFSYDQVLGDWEYVESTTLTSISHGSHMWPR